MKEVLNGVFILQATGSHLYTRSENRSNYMCMSVFVYTDWGIGCLRACGREDVRWHVQVGGEREAEIH